MPEAVVLALLIELLREGVVDGKAMAAMLDVRGEPDAARFVRCAVMEASVARMSTPARPTALRVVK